MFAHVALIRLPHIDKLYRAECILNTSVMGIIALRITVTQCNSELKYRLRDLVRCHTCVFDRELYSENETRVTATSHDATRDMPCHTWDF